MIPTMIFFLISCRRRVAKCYEEAVNELPSDLNCWGIMQIFVVSILRSISREDMGGVSLSGLIAYMSRV